MTFSSFSYPYRPCHNITRFSATVVLDSGIKRPTFYTVVCPMLPAAYTCPDILHSSRRTPIPGNSLFPQRSTFAFNGLRFFRGLFLRSNASSHARASTLVLGITTLVTDDLRSPHDLPGTWRLPFAPNAHTCTQ